MVSFQTPRVFSYNTCCVEKDTGNQFADYFYFFLLYTTFIATQNLRKSRLCGYFNQSWIDSKSSLSTSLLTSQLFTA